MDTTALVTVLSQLGLAAAAYRLAKQIGKRLEATDAKVDAHEQRIGVLEGAR